MQVAAAVVGGGAREEDEASEIKEMVVELEEGIQAASVADVAEADRVVKFVAVGVSPMCCQNAKV